DRGNRSYEHILALGRCPAPHDIGTVGCEYCASPPPWCSRWEAEPRGPPSGEGTAATSPAEATAVERCREAGRSGLGASVAAQPRASTTTVTTSGHTSS